MNLYINAVNGSNIVMRATKYTRPSGEDKLKRNPLGHHEELVLTN